MTAPIRLTLAVISPKLGLVPWTDPPRDGEIR